MSDQIKVQCTFTIKEGKLTYTDALYYDYATYSSVNQSDIDTAKQARFMAYKTEIAKPQPVLDVDRAIADCQAQIDYYTTQKAEYTAQKQASGGAK